MRPELLISSAVSSFDSGHTHVLHPENSKFMFKFSARQVSHRYIDVHRYGTEKTLKLMGF